MCQTDTFIVNQTQFCRVNYTCMKIMNLIFFSGAVLIIPISELPMAKNKFWVKLSQQCEFKLIGWIKVSVWHNKSVRLTMQGHQKVSNSRKSQVNEVKVYQSGKQLKVYWRTSPEEFFQTLKNLQEMKNYWLKLRTGYFKCQTDTLIKFWYNFIFS